MDRYRVPILAVTGVFGLLGGFYVQDVMIERYRAERNRKIRQIVDEEERMEKQMKLQEDKEND